MLTDLAQSKAELVDVSETWRAIEPLDPSFRPLGRRLLMKLTGLKAWNDAVSVGLKLTKFESGDRQVFETIATAANATGQHKLAAGMLQNAKSLGTTEALERFRPALRVRRDFSHPARSRFSADGADDFFAFCFEPYGLRRHARRS